MKRDQSPELAVTKCDRANSLTQAKRVHLGTVWCLQVLKSFPAEARMAMEAVPVQFAQPAQGSDDLLQLVGLEVEENVLELRAVQVQANTATGGGHVRA